MAAPSPPPHEITLHASAVAFAGCAALIRGASGSGKSTLALDMVSRGAMLISDDQTHLRRDGDVILASAPAAIEGRIEARGVGLLNCPAAGPIPLACVVDLDMVETERLPIAAQTDILGRAFPLVRRSEMTCFSAALILYLAHGRFA